MRSNYKPPPAIIFINGDITYPPTGPVFIGAQPGNPSSDAGTSELTNLQIQLFIDDTITKAEFDARVAGDPNYPTIVHLQDLRVLVILPVNVPFCEETINFEYADVVMFLHQGLADIEKNRFGPPGQNYDIQRINIYAVLRAVEHCHNDIIVPFEMCGQGCGSCNYPFYCDKCHTFSGIRICRKCDCTCQCGCTCLIDNQGIKQSPIYAPNCDNEYHNPAFIFRK
jgi:hypothetical protein